MNKVGSTSVIVKHHVNYKTIYELQSVLGPLQCTVRVHHTEKDHPTYQTALNYDKLRLHNLFAATVLKGINLRNEKEMTYLKYQSFFYPGKIPSSKLRRHIN